MPINTTGAESVVSLFDTLGINEREVENASIIINPQYMKPKLDIILEQRVGGVMKKSGNRTFTLFRMENDYGKMPIAGRQSIGGALKLTSSETNFELIANGNKVFAKSGAIGKVIERGSGYLVVSFLSNPNGATAFTASDFVVGESAIDGGDVGDVNLRVSKDTIFVAPNPSQNIIGTMNQSFFLPFDAQHTKTYLPAINGKQAYYYQGEAQALGRLQKQYYASMYRNVPANFNATFPISASLVNQILTMGGTVNPLGANQAFTQSQFKGWMKAYINKGTFVNSEIIGICGPNFLMNFQEAFEENFIKYVGKNNTVGGESVVGIDYYEFAFGGLMIKLIVEPFLADPKIWETEGVYSVRSNSAIFMDTTPVKTENMGNIPFATCRYFGDVADIQRAVIKGITDENGRSSGNSATNPQKGTSIEFTWDKMIQLSNPAACMYIGS